MSEAAQAVLAGITMYDQRNTDVLVQSYLDGTFFYSSPKHQTLFRITQLLQGGAPGMTVCARGASLQIGREGSELNFPADLS